MRAHEHELKGDAYMRQFEDTGDQRSLDLAHKHWALANQKQTQERQDRAENRSTATTARTGPGLSFGGVIGVVLAALCALIAVWPTLAFAVGLLMLAAPGFVAGWLTSLVDVPGRVRRVDWAHTSTGTRIAVGSLVTAVIAVAAGLDVHDPPDSQVGNGAAAAVREEKVWGVTPQLNRHRVCGATSIRRCSPSSLPLPSRWW